MKLIWRKSTLKRRLCKISRFIELLHFGGYVHCKKYPGDFPKVTKQKVPIRLLVHPFSVSSGNFLVAFGGSW